MPCGETIFCVFSLSVRPHISKFMVRFYRAEFSHSLGPWPTPPIRSRASPLIGAHRPCERWAVEAVAPAYDPEETFDQAHGCKCSGRNLYLVCADDNLSRSV